MPIYQKRDDKFKKDVEKASKSDPKLGEYPLEVLMEAKKERIRELGKVLNKKILEDDY